MKSRSHAECLWAILILIACWSSPARADTLVLPDRLVFGKLIAVASTTVTFAPECGAAQTFAKSEIRQIVRDASCKPKPVRPYSAGGEVCEQTPLSLYEVTLRSPKQTLLAADFQVANGRMHLQSADGLVNFHGPETRLVSAARGLFCRSAIPDAPLIRGFCREDVQWAVNFGYDSIFNNHILTRGLSFYLEDDSGRAIPPDDPRSIAVRDGFGNAITKWMGALQDLGDRLPAGARQAVSSMIGHTSGGYAVLTPPQVVRVGCPDTASFVVRWITKSAKSMTVAGRVKAARAQVEGRTLWINAVTIPCWKATLTPELIIPGEGSNAQSCSNLTPILIHEIGHALGLTGHLDIGDRPSIMDSVIWPGLTSPTEADAFALAAVLSQPIRGAVAGRLDGDGMGVEIGVVTVPQR